MRFNVELPAGLKEILEKEYKEFIRVTPMTRKERSVLLHWVREGNSVYDNPSGVWYDGQVPVDFLTIWRDEEYIRQHTKGMSKEDTIAFAMAYYGWDNTSESIEPVDDGYVVRTTAEDAELPF